MTLRAKMSCAAFVVLHTGVYAAHVATLVLLFRLGLQPPAETNIDGSSLLVQAIFLLSLLIMVSSVCLWAAWRELRTLNLSPLWFGLLLPTALPLLGLAQLIQPWLLWKDLCQLRLPTPGSAQASASPSGTFARRFYASGLETVTQGGAFAAASVALLSSSMALDVRSRLVLWLCAGLSWLSASLALVEMDQALSDTAAACLLKCPGRTLPLHFMLRGFEVGSRLWVLLVLAALLRADHLEVSPGVPLIPLMLFADYIFTAAILFGGRSCRKLALLLALPAMAANPLKFVDVAAWSIRARKVSKRLAVLRHLELLAASTGAVAWLMGYWSSWSPRTGSLHSWTDFKDFLKDEGNILPVAGAACILFYHLFAFALGRAHAEQVRADGLHRAAARGDAEAVARLLRELAPVVAHAIDPASSCRPGASGLLDGGPVNALSADGLTPLHLAACSGADRVVRELIRAHAEVSLAARDTGATPLMLSAEKGNDKVLRLLLTNGAGEALHKAGPDGNTALHLAAREGHSECIHRLLRARANPQTRNARGFSAFDLARLQKNAEGEVSASQLLSTSLSEVAKDTFLGSLPPGPKPLPEGEILEAESPDAWPLRLPVRLEPDTPETSTRGGTPHRGSVTPRPSAAASPSAPSPSVTARSGAGSVLDVPVVAAADSALDELLAEATRAGLRTSVAHSPAAAAAASVLTGTSRTSQNNSVLRPFSASRGTPLPRVTGLASLVTWASPGAFRLLLASSRAPGQGRMPGNRSLGEATPTKEYHLRYFRIVGLIGEGSFGSVYEVCDLRPTLSGANPLGLDRRCALKILHRRQYLAQDMLARAKQERQVLKAARHPFIVRLLCAFRTPGGEMALVMEYCPNGNLNDFIVRNGQPGLPEALSRKLIAEVLLALGYLHDELDVVFRDLKPENIVLDVAMHAKLTDFGLAKAEASSGSGARSFVGSMFFVAPEVTPAASRRYGPAVDIYALGLVAWVAFTGGVTSRAGSEAFPREAPLLSSCQNQRLPPESHEAMRAWLDERREESFSFGPLPKQSPRGPKQSPQMSSLAFAFVDTTRPWIDTTTSTEPLRRGSAAELRYHPFFVQSPLHPPLAEFSDWVALLPSVVEEEEPMSPASVNTEDSWCYGATRGN